jgi:hypothetical protein
VLLLPTAVQVCQDSPHLVDLLLLSGHDGFTEFANPLIYAGGRRARLDV